MEHRSFQGARGRLHYVVAGQGPALVLIHPIGLDATWWSDYLPRWTGRYRVICVDLLGHGRSDPVRGGVTLEEHAEDVIGILAREGGDAACVVGVSMGGMVAQHMALQAPAAVGRLILCATAGGFPEAARPLIRARGDVTRDGDMQSVVDATLARWFSEQASEALRQKCRERLLSDDWHSWSANWVAISGLDTLARLPGLDLPVLVVAGDADASIPPAVSKQIADAASRAKFVTVPGASHFGAFESPAKFQDLFDSFLASGN